MAIHKVRTHVAGRGVSPKTYRRVQKGDALWSVSTYTSLFCFFRSEVCRFYNTNRFLSNLKFILPYLIDFQELHRCRIRRQVFITLYRSHSSLWNSFNFMQIQGMWALALNFRFALVFNNSIKGCIFVKSSLCITLHYKLYSRYFYV